mgnify:CR=1 FL=1
MQTLNVREPSQVGSKSEVFADLPDGRTLAVLSGIALTNWEVDTDEVQHGETHVLLGVYGHSIDQWSAFVGLTSIANDETEFVFAVDTVKVGFHSSGSGELELIFSPHLMGEFSSIHGVSYQVVVTLKRVRPHIAGTISWPKPFFDPPTPDVAGVAGQLGVVATRYELPPALPGGLAVPPKIEPVTNGRIVKFEIGPNDYVAHYRIDEPPMGIDVKVTVNLGPKFSIAPPSRLMVGQVSGPDVFALKVGAPSIEDINFRVSEFVVR